MVSGFCTSAVAFGGAVILACGTSLADDYSNPNTSYTGPVSAVTTSDWGGIYAGGSLGYHFDTDDEIGLERVPNITGMAKENNLGRVDSKGVGAELNLGYRWELGDWVIGPVIGFTGSAAKASDRISALSFGVEGDLRAEVNNLLSLQWKAGYKLAEDMQVYGLIGGARGDFDYTLERTDGSISHHSYSDTGLTLGLGVERRITDRMSIYAEWELYKFGKTGVFFQEGASSVVTEATPAHQKIGVGINFGL